MPTVADLTYGLAGKPAWTLHARLAVVWWTHACEALNVFTDALASHDANAVRVASAATVATLEPTTNLVAEIDVPGRDGCLAALSSIATSLRGGELPESRPVAVVAEFFEFVRE